MKINMEKMTTAVTTSTLKVKPVIKKNRCTKSVTRFRQHKYNVRDWPPNKRGLYTHDHSPGQHINTQQGGRWSNSTHLIVVVVVIHPDPLPRRTFYEKQTELQMISLRLPWQQTFSLEYADMIVAMYNTDACIEYGVLAK